MSWGLVTHPNAKCQDGERLVDRHISAIGMHTRIGVHYLLKKEFFWVANGGTRARSLQVLFVCQLNLHEYRLH